MIRKLLLGSSFLLLGMIAAAVWWRIDSERIPDFEEPRQEPAALPDPNAFDILVQAVEAVPDTRAITDAVNGRRDPETGVFHDPTIGEKREVVEANALTLHLVREALKHPFMYPDLHETISGDGLIRLADFRILARLLDLEVGIHRADERYDLAVASALDCLELGNMVGRDSVIIGVLTGVAISGIARVHLPDMISRLNPETLNEAIGRIERLAETKVDYGQALQREKHFGRRQLQDMFNEKEWRIGLARMARMEHSMDIEMMWTDWDDFPLRQRVQMRLLAWRFHKGNMLRAYCQMMHDAQAAMKKPFVESAEAWPKASGHLAFLGSEDLADTFRNVWFTVLLDQATQEMLKTLLALEAYRQQSGRYPDRLDALEHGFVQALPRDPFDPGGLPLRYHTDGDGFLLYSVGPDGQDNGGQPMIRPGQPPERNYRPLPDLPGDVVAGVNVLRGRGR